MISCVIIEDELPAQKVMQHYLAKFPDVEIKGVFQTALDANQLLGETVVNLVFLDINLPDIPGIEYIKTIKNPPAIIITTAYPDYAVSSFELDTIVDYLVKPFSFNRFVKALNKAKERMSSGDKTPKPIFLNVDKSLHKIVLDELLYLESDRNYVTVVTQQKKLSYIDTLKGWIQKLPPNQFIQVHRSFIINISFIEKIVGNEVHINGIKIPIGRKYKQLLLDKVSVI